MRPQQKPKQAAAVILLRPAKPHGFEVFLTRRPDGMPFLSGIYCFPGGSLKKEDSVAAMLRLCHGLSPFAARKIVGAHFSPDEALGLWVAAIRKLFEEAGVLLAVNASGEPRAANPDHKTHLARKRSALLEKTLSFRSFLESEGLLCDVARLTYFSHWQIPGATSLQFDTRFFLATLPEEQSPMVASAEIAQSGWLTPDRALELFAKDGLPMIFPTFASLRTLADFESLDSLLKEYGSAFSPASKKDTGNR